MTKVVIIRLNIFKCHSNQVKNFINIEIAEAVRIDLTGLHSHHHLYNTIIKTILINIHLYIKCIKLF